MDKILRISISILVAYIISLTSTALCVTIKCKYENSKLKSSGHGYRCTVLDNLNITSPNTSIESIAEYHEIAKNDSDVIIFRARDMNIEYLPIGLEKFFANLKEISFQKCHVKEVHQADLKPFPQLTLVDFKTNDVMVLEEGLFDYNPELAWVSFYDNKIVHIHADIFNNLTKLTSLYLGLNLCAGSPVFNATSSPQNIIRELIAGGCTDREYLKIKNGLIELESDASNPIFEDIYSLKHELQNSKKFSKYTPFDKRMQNILRTASAIMWMDEKLPSLIDSYDKRVAKMDEKINQMKDQDEKFRHQTSQSLFNLKVMCCIIVAFCGPFMMVLVLAIYEFGGAFFSCRSKQRQEESIEFELSTFG